MHRRVEVFLDESGDLGFSGRSSRHFIVIALASPEPIQLNRLLKKVRRRVRPSGMKAPEFKFSSSPDRVRRLLLKGLSKTSSIVTWSAIVKADMPPADRGDKRGIYLRLSSAALSELMRRIHAGDVDIVLDKWSSNRSVRADIGRHLRGIANSCHGGHFAPSVSISYLDSANSAGIQLADVIAGAVFQSLEHADNSYLNHVTNLIVHGRIRP